MSIRPEIVPSPFTLEFLRRCFRFVSVEWPHATREQLPDEGFEQRFRESCIHNLDEWNISGQFEFRLGAGLDTASGVAHEIDIVARHSNAAAVLEAKNRGDMPTKNDIIIFHAKVVDYLLANPEITLNELCLAFMSRNSFQPRAIAACLGLGIHPVASDIRPFPVLVDNARRMDAVLHDGLVVSDAVRDRFEDWCALLNSLGFALNETWPDNRFGYLSEDSLLVRAVAPQQTDALAQQLRQANGECIDLLNIFRSASSSRGVGS